MTAAPCSALLPSSKHNPCPICGRTADGDCRTADGLAICHHGSSHHPPERLRPGEVIEGRDGQRWAFTRDTEDGRAAVFTLDKPRHQLGRVEPLGCSAKTSKAAPTKAPEPISGPVQLARLPQPTKEPPAHLPDGLQINYSPTQWVKVERDASGDKQHKPWHRDAEGREVNRKGSDPWPLWREAEALEHGPGRWLAEAEGEKCGAWLRAG